jgi:MFS family permease
MLLPISLGIGIGAILTGRLVTRTGNTMIFPSWGLIGCTIGFFIFAMWNAQMSQMQMIITLSFAALCMGTVMTVVQVTIQSAAGRKALGAAAASVQFSRTVGAPFGTALVGFILFVTLAVTDQQAAQTFEQLVNTGTSALDALPPARRVVVETEIAFAFRLAFMLIPVLTAIAAVLAWTNPSRRI